MQSKKMHSNHTWANPMPQRKIISVLNWTRDQIYNRGIEMVGLMLLRSKPQIDYRASSSLFYGDSKICDFIQFICGYYWLFDAIKSGRLLSTCQFIFHFITTHYTQCTNSSICKWKKPTNRKKNQVNKCYWNEWG